MNGPDFTIVEGTTYAFSIVWEDSGSPRAAIDIGGCTAIFRICPASSSQALVECSTENGGVVIGPQRGQLSVTISPDKTAGTSGGRWAGARYELRIAYPSGEIYSLVRGLVRLVPAVIE